MRKNNTSIVFLFSQTFNQTKDFVSFAGLFFYDITKGLRTIKDEFQGHVFVQIFVRGPQGICLPELCEVMCKSKETTKIRKVLRGLSFDFVLVRLCPLEAGQKLVNSHRRKFQCKFSLLSAWKRAFTESILLHCSFSFRVFH